MQYFRGEPTFYVSEVAKVAEGDAVKLEWLNLELGPGQDLITFAKKFLQLFSSVVTTVTKQKFTCLKLYRTYASIEGTTCKGDYENVEECRAKMYTMECQIPPYELRPFQLLWDSRAHRRCTECNIQLMDDWEGARCKKHTVVPTTVQYTCRALLDEDSPQMCGGPVTIVRGFGCCQKCGCGKELQETIVGHDAPEWVFRPLQKVVNARFLNEQHVDDTDRARPWTKKRRL